MSEIPEGLTQRMRAAAETLSEVASVFRPNDAARWSRSSYSSSMLHDIADRWDREARAKAEEEVGIEALARDIHLSRIVADVIHAKDWDEMSVWYQQVIRIEARQLWISGYRKGGA